MMRKCHAFFFTLLMGGVSHAEILPSDFDYSSVKGFKLNECTFSATRTPWQPPTIIFGLPPDSKRFDDIDVTWEENKLAVTAEIASYRVRVEKVLSIESLGAEGLSEDKWLEKIRNSKFLKVSVQDASGNEMPLRNSDHERVDSCYLGIGDYIAVGYNFFASNVSSSNAIVVYDKARDGAGKTFTYLTAHCSVSPVLK